MSADSRRRWEGKLNETNLAAAREILDIELPVKIRRSSGWRTVGSYRHRNGVHCIAISTYRTVEQASRTLWHELTHASQTERLWREGKVETVVDGVEYLLAAERLHSYARSPYEAEANAAQDFDDEYRLTR